MLLIPMTLKYNRWNKMGTVQRGKINRADQAHWDGKTKNVSRIDATGGTVTEQVVDDHVDVLQVFGDGSVYTVATIAAALNFIGSSNATLLWATGTWVIDSNVTIPATLANHIPAGCVFAISTGVTLTFSGPIYVEYGLNDGTGWYTLAGTGVVTCSLGASGFPGW